MRIIERLSVRSVVVVVLVLGGLGLAILDKDFRPLFGDLAKVGIGGYLGQLVPKQRE
ncbi:hypothetical protein [Calothrix sp. 336/3]|uniref:hypothetical protein n=1 Tax=Calothrix sp. 336/3 TaxID=1337936 RepID=UPI00143AF3CE|nr:hypothetical protein [Calothrix sp. 336/3]